MMEISGNINYRRLPNAESGVADGPFAYYQGLNGQELMASSDLGNGWNLGRYYTIHGNLKIEGHYQDAQVVNENDIVTGEAYGGKLFISTSPTLSYISERLKWSLGFPIETVWDNYDYMDMSKERMAYHHVRVRLGAGFRASYRPSAPWYFTISLGRSNRQKGNVTDFLLGTYRSAFDHSTTKNTLLLPLSSSLRGVFHTEYRRPIEGIFARLTLGYTKNTRNQMVNNILNQTDREIVVQKGKHTSHNGMGSFFISKHFRKIMTTSSLIADYSYFNHSIMVQGKIGSTAAKTFSLALSLNSAPINWLEINTEARYVKNEFQNIIATNYTDQWYINAGVNINIGDSFMAKIRNESIFMSQDHTPYPIFSILSSGLTYRKPRYQIELLLDNLLDKKVHYTYKSDDGDQHQIYTLLRPRQLLLRATLKY